MPSVHLILERIKYALLQITLRKKRKEKNSSENSIKPSALGSNHMYLTAAHIKLTLYHNVLFLT